MSEMQGKVTVRLASDDEISIARDIRYRVFVLGQGVTPELECDNLDKGALHAIAFSHGLPVGCGRLLLNSGSAHLCRVAVLEEYRNQGCGSGVCSFLIKEASKLGYTLVDIDAQLHAVPFYKGLGFAPVGAEFYEAGIKHIHMIKKV